MDAKPCNTLLLHNVYFINRYLTKKKNHFNIIENSISLMGHCVEAKFKLISENMVKHTNTTVKEI